MKPTLRNERASAERPEHVHRSGTQVALLEPLDPNRSVWLVEIRVVDEALVGGAWFDCIEVRLGELVFDDEIREDIAKAASFTGAEQPLGEDTPLDEIIAGAPPRKAA